jgi:tetratricopeptide (TPR) repeat protein
MAERRIQLVTAQAVLLCTVLIGCATLPGSGGDETPPLPVPGDHGREAVMRPVSESLLLQSRQEQQYGDYGQAAATLERAIRIDPAEPAVWLELARVRYAENNWPQAEQLARKAYSLAGVASPLRADAARLIADALVMQGRPQ